MRVALVSPAIGATPRGNRTTVERWVRLARDIEVCPVTPEGLNDLDATPDLVHGYHALHGGQAAQTYADAKGLPLVISLGGTDLFAWRQREGAWSEVQAVLEAATVITGAFDAFGDELPGAARYVTVPRSVLVTPARATSGGPRPVRALLPAGLRPVKGVLEAVRLGIALHAEGALGDLIVIGPDLDPGYARRVRDAVVDHPAIRIADFPEWEMSKLYGLADVVWNTSEHEGGSNALLEGWAHGLPLFARATPGNRELLQGAPDSIQCSSSMEDFERIRAFHQRITTAATATKRTWGDEARAWVEQQHAPATEADALRAAWRLAIELG